MITKLEKQFTGTGEVKGFVFTQIKETEAHYIYQIEKTELNFHFEVFEKKTAPLCIDFEKRIYSETDFKEVYPKANDFGAWAWTFPTYKGCIEKISN